MVREGTRKYCLGTAIKIIAIINIDTATTATIKIVDPSSTTKINDVAMTKESNQVYSYVYQSNENDEEGKYIVTIKVTSSGYTSVRQHYFEMQEQDD